MSEVVGSIYIVDLTCRSLPYDTHLAGGLKRNGAKVDLWIAGCLPEQHRETCGRSILDVARNTPTSKLRKITKAAEYMMNGLGLHWSIRTELPDIVHYQWLPFTNQMPSAEVVNLDWAKRNDSGVVLTVHNVLPHDTGKKYRRNFKRIYNVPDALICHTDESKRKLVREFNISSGKVWVIPHGPLSDVVSSVSQEKARAQLEIELEMPLCLLFGFMRPYKGVEYLLDSWKLVKERVPSARLMLAGQPEPRYEEVLVDKIEKLGLKHEVDARFKFLTQEQLSFCIRAADVLVYPYRSITQSGALLTGLTAGKPIVATEVGGFSEMIQHEQTGLLVQYGNDTQLADELAHLLQNSEKREQLGQAAQEMVETEYSWDAIAHKTLECYRSVTA